MSRPYLILTGLFCFLFVYLLSAEVYQRYAETISLFSSLHKRQSAIHDPLSLEAQKAHLIAERRRLSAVIMADKSGYKQNEIGVIQCVTDNAREERVVVSSFVPQATIHVGQFEEFSFNLSARGRFSRLGALINALENQTMPFQIKRVEIVSEPIGQSNLKATIEGKAILYHGFQ